MDDDEDEGDDEVEDQPDVDHLDVGRCGKTLVHLPSNEAWPIVLQHEMDIQLLAMILMSHFQSIETQWQGCWQHMNNINQGPQLEQKQP